MKRAIAVALVLSLSALATAADKATQVKAQKEVQALLVRMAEAEKKGDVAALSLCYEEEGMLLPSSGEPVRGRADISRRYQAIFAGKTPRPPLESEELWVLDDWAVSRGATRQPSAVLNVKGAERNRYVMTLKKHGDSWEIHSLVWTPGRPGK